MVVGIISDIHGHLSNEAIAALDGVDMILCAGDVERESILMELEAIAPTITVMGNCDYGRISMSVPSVATPRIEGVRFYMVHKPKDIGSVPEDTQVIVHGHTHVPRNQTIQGIRYLNPGSASRPRGGSKKSIIRLTTKGGRVDSVELVEL